MSTRLNCYLNAIKKLCDADNRDDLANRVCVYDLTRVYRAKYKKLDKKRGAK